MKTTSKYRTCRVCEEEKLLEDFHEFNNKGYVYRRKDCKICFNRMKHRNARAKRHQETITGIKGIVKKRREYYKKNKEKINARRRGKKAQEFSAKTENALKEGDIFED